MRPDETTAAHLGLTGEPRATRPLWIRLLVLVALFTFGLVAAGWGGEFLTAFGGTIMTAALVGFVLILVQEHRARRSL